MWDPRLLCLSILLYSHFSYGIKIQSVSISGLGSTQEQPLNEVGGTPAVVRCDITGPWSSCKWIHRFVRENTEIEEEFFCPITQGAGTADCNPDNIDPGYKRRIKIEEKSSSCEIKITNPNYLDSGIWECLADGGSDSAFMRGSVEIFVSRRAEVYISEPDMESGGNKYIVFDMRNSRPRIFSKCRSYHSIPIPQFHWYVNEVNPRNEISGQDVQVSEPKTRKDARGEYTEHTLDWSPKDLCQNYNIDPVLCEHEEFEFDLLCIIDQGEYYTTENEDNIQRVTVRVVGNSAMSLSAGFIAVFLSSILLIK